MLLARSYLKHPGTEKQAEKELLQALEESPDNVDALLELGGIYQDRGLPTRAAGMYRKVLDLRPGHRAAGEALASLEPEPSPPAPPPAAGLLRKLFRWS